MSRILLLGGECIKAEVSISWWQRQPLKTRERVRELGGIWAGNEVIENEETGERVFVGTRDERKN